MTVASLIADLKASLGESKVFTPEHPEYNELLGRWTESASKPAVRVLR